MSTVLSKMPRQKLSYKSKNKTWRKENVDQGDKFSYYTNESVRQTIQNRVTNLNLYNGILDPRDLVTTLNPHGLKADFIPEEIPHHPIMVPKLDVLVGEEINRKFDWHLTVTNPDAISAKEKDKVKEVRKRLISLMQSNLSKEELETELRGLDKYMRYEYQDLRERMGNHLLKHYYEELSFAKKFNAGFKDALIMGEEIYQCDIVSKEPILEKLNPLKVHTVRSGNSSAIEDSDLIVIEDHWSPGRIIDTFYDQLKPKEIEFITQYTTSTKGSYTSDDENHLLIRDNIDAYIDIAEINGHSFNSNYTDATGNIRVLRVYWRSQKKIQKVKYYDQFGQTQYKIMSEEYIADKGLGEESTTLWVNEWWEGTKIGKDIYIQMRPKEVQYNRLNNPSKCSSGIVGEIYNTNQGKAVSLVDRMKNYQYLYDVIWDRLNKAIAKNLGKILLLDISMVPNGWEPEKWIAQATSMGLGIVDGFKEGNAGAAQGKLAGGLNGNNTKAIDLETGNYIQQHINLLEYIKMEMGEIAGISKQREGNVSNRETLGGVERAVTQSAHITEWWFMKHEDLKKRVLKTFLETAKYALKGRNKKLEYISDDFSKHILEVDGTLISDCDFGLTITTSTQTEKVKNTLEQLAQAFMQNGGSFSTVIDIMTSSSIADMRKKIEYNEDLVRQQESQARQQEAELAQQEEMNKQALEQAKLQMDKYKIDADNQTKIQIEMMKQNEAVDARDNNNDGVDDISADDKLKLEYDKMKNDLLIKMEDMQQKMEMHKDKMQREDKKIAASKQKAATSSSTK